MDRASADAVGMIATSSTPLPLQEHLECQLCGCMLHAGPLRRGSRWSRSPSRSSAGERFAISRRGGSSSWPREAGNPYFTTTPAAVLAPWSAVRGLLKGTKVDGDVHRDLRCGIGMPRGCRT